MDSTAHSLSPQDDDLGKEVRQSVVLLGLSLAVTAFVTVAAQATLSLLGS